VFQCGGEAIGVQEQADAAAAEALTAAVCGERVGRGGEADGALFGGVGHWQFLSNPVELELEAHTCAASFSTPQAFACLYTLYTLEKISAESADRE
jgi:hypothetical protein